MAENSKREQIIMADYALVSAVSSIKAVQRVMPAFAELENFAQTQFPVCAIVGRLPVPLEKRSTREINVDQIISEIKVDVFTYLQERAGQNVDTEISNIADDLWAALYNDQARGGLVIDTIIQINEKVNVWNPFAAFQITAIHKYVHYTGGI